MYTLFSTAFLLILCTSMTLILIYCRYITEDKTVVGRHHHTTDTTVKRCKVFFPFYFVKYAPY